MGNNLEEVEILYENQFTVVRKMKDTTKNNFVVVKEIKNMDHLTKLFFDREINALKKLNNCTSIVKMNHYEVIPINENHSVGKIFLEFLEGQSLANVDLALIDIRERYGILKQIIDAVESAHSNNIIHRDIKPDNIMITDYRYAKLIDFGISKIKGMVTRATVGNFSSNFYTAPEVGYHQENATFQSDLFSLGVTLFYLLTNCEPRLPTEFQTQLLETTGINPTLKQILMKATQLDPKDRYENITDLKRDVMVSLGELFNVSKFLISVPTTILQKAKSRRFIPNGISFQEFIDKHLPQWFKGSFAFIESSLNGNSRLEENHDVIFYANQYKLRCTYNEKEEYFIIEDIIHVAPKVRNYLSETYMKVNGIISFIASGSRYTTEHSTYELATELTEHRMAYESDDSKRNAFDRFFSIWIDYLNKEKELLKSSAKTIDYKSIQKNANTVELELDFDIEVDQLDFNHETNLIYDPTYLNTKAREKITQIGNYKDIRYADGKIILTLESAKGFKPSTIPQVGFVVTDYKSSSFVIEKQIKALQLLRRNESECNENLRDLILGFEKPTNYENLTEISFFNKDLDINQRDAVKKALNTSSVCVIQGPPGTGKTSVIREFVNQIIKRNSDEIGLRKNRILIVSQSHTAVDHVLEGLELNDKLNTKVIRIGKSANVLEGIWKKFSVENSHTNWVINTTKASNTRMAEITSYYGIDQSDLDKYCEIIFKQKRQEFIDEACIAFIEEFERTLDEEKWRIVRTTQIQKEWVARLKLAKDSEERVVENSTIVAGTCTGFNSNSIVKSMAFDYVIVDEAAKASVPEILIPLLRGSRLILVGDHNQLPPIIKDEVIKNCYNKDKKNYENGLFAHLFEQFPSSNRVQLSMQYRMHRTIGKMISEVFYDSRIDTGIEDSKRSHQVIPFIDKQIVWVSTSDYPLEKKKDSEGVGRSFVNILEIREIKNLLIKLDQEASKDFEVAVITGYSAQKFAIAEAIKVLRFKHLSLNNIEVNTVDAYQGRDKDIVIYSTVRSNIKDEIGFQRSEKRVNVALSRARRLLILVGDHLMFGRNKEVTNRFPGIINYMNRHVECSIQRLEVKND
ncbi:serine/threonine-protein kinase [Paenibacillus qinlingensis]|uniref:serine/threonine-protein kinase n=1 Tax=Paenibacillus qinlingensis TaxID=1837343 RepID=UPI00156507C3|nr:serine/threonine-protein kinase [Paenibacillus qinlingensis]NQX62214.1 protein kinase [Paenibacillus qinlingensis]